MRKRDEDRALRLPTDRSGVAYQEYHGVYGEDVEAALRFLFAAMAPKSEADFPLQGIPQMLYMDNGPIARSQVFQQVMRYLGVEVRSHLPQSQTGRKAAARAKGKVERPFRTVKEMHETLYHFHEPTSEEEANAWLMRFLLRYNMMQHRSESHSRFEDWLRSGPVSSQEMLVRDHPLPVPGLSDRNGSGKFAILGQIDQSIDWYRSEVGSRHFVAGKQVRQFLEYDLRT